MVQAVNTKAILALASVARRPALMVPHLAVENISQVDFDAMKECGGIRGVIFDKDNTLTAPYESSIHPDARVGLENAVRVFGVDGCAILSNSAGTNDDPDFVDALRIEESLGLPVIRHSEKKPGGLREVLDHFKMKDAARLCMVGDRVLTDIVFGNLYEMLTVHTLPLCRGEDNTKDNWTAKTIRPVENGIIYGNWFGARRLQRRKLTHKYWSEEECSLLLTDDGT